MEISGESKWTEIPPEILLKIAKLCSATANSTLSFSCKLQLRRLGAVCKPWRSAISRVSREFNEYRQSHDTPIPIPVFRQICYNLPHPMNMPIDPFEGSLYLVPTTVCLVRSTKTGSEAHLLVVEHLGGVNGKVYCRKPLLTSHDMSSTWNVRCPKSINLLDYHFSVVAEEYCLRILMKGDNGVLEFVESHKSFCKKAVIIRNPNLKDGFGMDHGVVFVLFDGGVLAMYVFSEKRWEYVFDVGNSKSDKCSDVQRYEDGSVVVIDHKANAFLVQYDFTARKVCLTKIGNEIRGSRDRRKRLVLEPERGGLFLVVQNSSLQNLDELKMVYIVYIFRPRQQKWQKLQDVPGYILFVGCDFAFTTSEKAFPRVCNGDCIFVSEGSFPLYKDGPDHLADAFFKEIDNSLCVYQSGREFACAGGICYLWGGICFCSIFYSPNEWLEWNDLPPSPVPQIPLEQKHGLQVEPKTDSRSGVCGTGSVKLMLDLNVHPDLVELTRSSSDCTEIPEAKEKRTADDSGLVDSTKSSRLPKSRKITSSTCSSEVINPNSEEGFELIQPLLKSISDLVNSPAVAQSDQRGYTSAEVLQELSCLPDTDLSSDFSACLLLEKKENQELYVCHAVGDIKDKWLHFVFDRSQM